MTEKPIDVGVHDADAEAAAEFEADQNMTCGDFCRGIVQNIKTRTGKDWATTFLRVCILVTALYFFLFSLDLMGASFKVLGGCTAGAMFNGISNPIAGVMIGILATVLVQSSSTSTSVVVSLVGAGAMTVQVGIPVIMGANIGTSVTNTIVAMGQINNKDQFEKAFAGATVHDMFNFLTVAILLPVEAITHMLYHLTKTMMPDSMTAGEAWEGPIKLWVGPLVQQVLYVNKDVTKNIAKGTTTCDVVYATTPVKGLIKCWTNDDGTKSCPAFYTENASQADDMASGGVCLGISLFLLCLCLFVLVKTLQSMVMGTSARMMRRATTMPAILAMGVGCGLTILVQSSSITTSVLTPLVGLDIISLEAMFPLTLGANLGTTCTALLASLVSTKPESVQIALCHLMFNFFGIMIWYPLPFMRQIPLEAARTLGALTRKWRGVCVVYILLCFIFIPAILLGVSSLYDSGGAFYVVGVILTICLVSFVCWFLYWWKRQDGRNTTIALFANRQERSEMMKKLPDTIKLLETKVDMLMKRNNLVVDDSGFNSLKKLSESQIAPEVASK